MPALQAPDKAVGSLLAIRIFCAAAGLFTVHRVKACAKRPGIRQRVVPMQTALDANPSPLGICRLGTVNVFQQVADMDGDQHAPDRCRHVLLQLLDETEVSAIVVDHLDAFRPPNLATTRQAA
jgi:hypothetical protein